MKEQALINYPGSNLDHYHALKKTQEVVINTSEYDSKMETILQDKSQYVEVELDPSQDFKSKVVAWADEYVKNDDIDDITYKFVTDVDPKPGNA